MGTPLIMKAYQLMICSLCKKTPNTALFSLLSEGFALSEALAVHILFVTSAGGINQKNRIIIFSQNQ